MASRRNASLFLLLCVISTAALAQPRPGEPMGPMMGPRHGIPLYYDAVTMPTPDTSSVTVDVHFRVPRNFFIYVRNDDGSGDSTFMATGEILVELLDSLSETVTRDLRFVRLYRSEPLLDGNPGGEIIGLSHFTVRPATYRLAFSIDDKQSGRNFADRSRMITAKALSPLSLNVSQPFLVRPAALADSISIDMVDAFNYGGDFLFGGKPAMAALQVFTADSAPDFRVHWMLVNKASLYGIDSAEFSGNASRVVTGRLVSTGSPDTTLYNLTRTDPGWYTVLLPLPFEKLFEGRGDIRVQLSTRSASQEVSESFRIVWPTKPGALMDLDLAIDALQHIATDEQMSAMRSMSLSARMNAFFKFWRALDPDTTTAYNEKFAEYYRRVDIAMVRFRAPKDVEGYRTDMGRIFILYGEPTSSKRIFSPDNDTQEVWTYEKLKQRFVFTDKFKTGIYILSEVQQL